MLRRSAILASLFAVFAFGEELPRKRETLLMLPEPLALRNSLSIVPAGAKQTVLTPAREKVGTPGSIEAYSEEDFATLGLSAETFAKRAAAARWGTDLDAGRMRGASAPYAEVPKPQCPPPTPTPTPKRSHSDSCPEPQAAAGRKVVGTMPTLGGGEWGVTQVLLDGWTAAYPGIDVKAELRKAKAWLLSNPTNAKTARGMGRFCNGWLERAQNAVGRNGTGPPVERESLQARVARKNPLKLIYDATGESDGQRAIGGPVVGDGGDLRPPLDGSHGGKP